MARAARLLLEDGASFLLLEDGATFFDLEEGTVDDGAESPAYQESPAGRPSKDRSRGKRRRVVIDDQVYEVPERDLPALLEATMLNKRPPSTAEPVEAAPAAPKPRKPLKTAAQGFAVPQMVLPTVAEAQARYEALLAQVNAQAADDVRRMLDRVAERVLMDLQDDEDAAELLLMGA